MTIAVKPYADNGYPRLSLLNKCVACRVLTAMMCDFENIACRYIVFFRRSGRITRQQKCSTLDFGIKHK